MKFLTLDCHKNDINQLFNNVSFIIFNYDRCVEHFIFHFLQNYYGIDPDEAAEIISGVKLFHPYGLVGQLPWQTGGDGTPFGSNDHLWQLLSLADQIKTFAERIEDEAEIHKMRQLVQEASQIVFLGFAFHMQNMDLITPQGKTDINRVFATAVGISTSNCDVIEADILSRFGDTQHHIDLNFRQKIDCRYLLDEYRRILLGPPSSPI